MRTRQAWGALWWDHLDHLGKGIFITVWGLRTPLSPKPAAPAGWVPWGALLLALETCSTTRSIPEGNVGKRERGPSRGAVKGSGMSPHGDYTTDIPATTA